jgi:ATP-dependent Clp protease ATP-binding subunit ClpC
MFERFTERARRVLFFALLEASQTGCNAISTEHLFLGLMRENMYLLPEFPPGSDLAAIRSELFGHPPAETVPTSPDINRNPTVNRMPAPHVDMPLTESAQRVLQHSGHERYSLKHDFVTSGHLLLGILDEEQSDACAILKRYGVQREQVMTRLPDTSEEQGPPNPDIALDL